MQATPAKMAESLDPVVKETRLEDVELDLQRDVLQTLHDDLVHGIRAVDVCSKLFTVGLLTEREQSDTLARARYSPHDATEVIVSALRCLHKGKETSSLLYRALKEILGYEDIAERIRQAFLCKDIEIARPQSPPPSPVGSLPLPQLATTDNDSFRQGQVTENVSPASFHPTSFCPERQSFNNILSSPVPGEVVLPTPPEHVYEPSDVEDLNTPFGRLMAKAYETVCALSPGKLRGLCRLLSTILKKNAFDKGVSIEENHQTVAKLVTGADQDFVNHLILSQSIEMIGDPDLSRMLQQYEAKLKDHKEKCIYSHDPLPGKRKLCIEEDYVLLRMGHKQKHREEFQLDHVITELDFLRKIVATERIKFEGFTSGSVCLYFSMPKEAVFVLIPGLEHNLGRLLEWRVTEITVYGYFTFDLDGDTTVEFWPQGIDRKLKSDLVMAKSELEGLKMSQNNKSKMAGSRMNTSTRNFKEMVKDLMDTKKNLTESEKEKQRLSEELKVLKFNPEKLSSDPLNSAEGKASAQRDSLSEKLDITQAELTKAQEKNEASSIRCQELEKECQKLKQHKAELELHLKEICEEAKDMWLKHEKYRKRIIELKALQSNVQEELSQCQAVLNTAEQEKEASKIECQQLEKQCQQLRPLPVELEAKLDKTQAELRKPLEQNAGSSIRCHVLRQHIAELKAKLDKTQEGLTKALEQNEGSSIRCQELEKECQDLRQHKAELEALLSNTQEELSQCQAELNTAEQEKEASTIKCQQLKKRCQQLCRSSSDDLGAKIASCFQDLEKGITEAVRSHSEAPESKDPCQLSPAEKRSQSTPGERRDVGKTEKTASILLQGDIEDQKPETSDVVRLIDNSICFKWKVFGCHLRVKDTLINKIQCDNPHSVDDCFLNLISLWLQGNGDTGSLQRTWKTVLSTTEEMGLPNVTTKLLDKLQDFK